MKVPPKRKGNTHAAQRGVQPLTTLNESPSEKEGKCFLASVPSRYLQALNESPSEKEGKSEFESDKRGLFRCPQ